MILGGLLPWIAPGILVLLVVRWLRPRRRAAGGGNPPLPETDGGPTPTPPRPTGMLVGVGVGVGATGDGERTPGASTAHGRVPTAPAVRDD